MEDWLAVPVAKARWFWRRKEWRQRPGPHGSLNQGSGFRPAFPGDSERLVEKYLRIRARPQVRLFLLPSLPLNPPWEGHAPWKGGHHLD